MKRFRQFVSVCSNVSVSKEVNTEKKSNSLSLRSSGSAVNKENSPPTQESEAIKTTASSVNDADCSVVNPLAGATMEDIFISKTAVTPVSANKKS